MSDVAGIPNKKKVGDKWTIAVDFDGVIHSFTSPWVSAEHIPDPPVEGAVEWLNEMSKHFEVVIHSTRAKSPTACKAVVQYLLDHGYTGHTLTVTHEKPPALIYLDDRAVRFEGPGSFPTRDFIHAARPWNKSA